MNLKGKQVACHLRHTLANTISPDDLFDSLLRSDIFRIFWWEQTFALIQQTRVAKPTTNQPVYEQFNFPPTNMKEVQDKNKTKTSQSQSPKLLHNLKLFSFHIWQVCKKLTSYTISNEMWHRLLSCFPEQKFPVEWHRKLSVASKNWNSQLSEKKQKEVTSVPMSLLSGVFVEGCEGGTVAAAETIRVHFVQFSQDVTERSIPQDE